MLTTDFWEKVIGETVLYFECDTMLCPNSEHKIQDFEDGKYYDVIKKGIRLHRWLLG